MTGDPVSVTDQHQAALRRAISLLRRHSYLEETISVSAPP